MIDRTISLEHVNRLFDSSIHASVKSDPIVAARHRSFISSHVLGALLSLAVFIFYFATASLPTTYAMITCAWFLTPLLIALFLSRTGALALAHFLSAANLIGLVVLAATLTGGIYSFVIVWMIVVPLEAALSASRRIIVWSSVAAAAALLGLYGATVLDLLPPPIDTGVSKTGRELFSHLAAAIYSGALALNIETIHRQSARRIEQEHARFRLLADHANDLISRHSTTGRVLFASPACQRLTGEPPEALAGDGLLERVLVADRPTYLAALADAARGDSTDVEYRLRRLGAAPGEAPVYFWAEMRCRPAEDREAEVPSETGAAWAAREVVAVTRDISRRKRYEGELVAARAAADAANRAKSMFLTNMSHELRTPLNAIIGFSEILLAEKKAKPELSTDQERSREHASIIRDSGRQLLVMVNELLDISKIESGHYRLELQPVDVAEIARACSATLRPVFADKRLSIVIDAEDDGTDIEADARCMRQILLNLLGNAIKFSDAGKSITVRLRLQAEYLMVQVVDQGIGIAAEDIARLGQPFIQVASGYGRPYEGTGLGLSLVKGMTRLHGGEFAISSALGQGTTMTLRLPVRQAAAQVGIPETQHRVLHTLVPVPAATGAGPDQPGLLPTAAANGRASRAEPLAAARAS